MDQRQPPQGYHPQAQQPQAPFQMPEQPSNQIPVLEPQPPADTALLFAGCKRAIVPTILQASQGGYITVIPGVGVYASTSMEEVMAFIEKSAMDHFKGQGVMSEFPKVLRKAKDSLREATARVDGLAMGLIGAAMLAGFVMFGGTSVETRESPVRASAAWQAEGSPLLHDSGGRSHTRFSRPIVLPEIQLLKVRSTLNDGDAERPLQAGELRPMRSHD